VFDVVFDTNARVSALIRPGRPRELWNKVLEGKIQLVISKGLLSEFDEVMSRPQFRRYVRRVALARFRKILFQNARLTRIRTRVDLIKEDTDDNIVLEAALNGRADYIVSGDGHLLVLKSFKGIKIVSVNEMLGLFMEA
jgi:putative PIN family toxin of toxin-antitoxin system